LILSSHAHFPEHVKRIDVIYRLPANSFRLSLDKHSPLTDPLPPVFARQSRTRARPPWCPSG
jgi:hypothetical protein